MVLNRLGNKRKLAARIIEHIPDHQLWIEPFFGAGGMFFAKDRAERNIVNDMDSEVYNLFCVVMDRTEELEEAWCSMPIHETLWKTWKREVPDDPVLRAVRFLFQSNFGFLGKPQTLKWNNRTAKRRLQDRIAQTRDALYDVEFMCCDFRSMLGRIPLSKGEASRAFVYCDPPYLGTDNNYGEAAQWNLQDTRDLFDLLVASGLRFAVSEFDGPDVRELANAHGLRTVVIGERHNLRNRRTEVLIVNN